MLVSRNGVAPRVDPTARVASTASVVGDVTVGPGCYVDYGVVIASSGPPVLLGTGVTVLANAVIRSVGGHGRPAFAVRVGDESIIAPRSRSLDVRSRRAATSQRPSSFCREPESVEAHAWR